VLPEMVVPFSGCLVTDLGEAVTISQRQLPPHMTAFASTTKGICLHTTQHLPTQPVAPPQTVAFDSTSTGICHLNQWHLRTKSRAFAHALKGSCLHNQRYLSSQLKAFSSTVAFAHTYILSHHACSNSNCETNRMVHLPRHFKLD